MTKEHAYETESIAENHRERGEFVRAGEYYTLAAYEYLGAHPPGRFGKGVSQGLYYLLYSVINGVYHYVRAEDFDATDKPISGIRIRSAYKGTATKLVRLKERYDLEIIWPN